MENTTIIYGAMQALLLLLSYVSSPYKIKKRKIVVGGVIILTVIATFVPDYQWLRLVLIGLCIGWSLRSIP